MHLVVLVHGLNGSPSELNFILKQLKKQYPEPLVKIPHCNYGKTGDGIIQGSQRLFEWILDEMTKNDITHLSFIAHSLGGIYARCCIGILYQHGVIPKLLKCINFITLATPHLGAREHVKLFDKLHAWVVKKILRNNTILELTITDQLNHEESIFYTLIEDNYIEALKLFPNLIAYANTKETTVNYKSSAIRRVKMNGKHLWPSILRDTQIENYENHLSIEDKIFKVLNTLSWRRFAVFPKNYFSAHTDIVVKSEQTDKKNGSNVVKHIVEEFVHPLLKKESKSNVVLGNHLVVFVGNQFDRFKALAKSLKREETKFGVVNCSRYHNSIEENSDEIYKVVKNCLSNGNYSNISFASEAIGCIYSKYVIGKLFGEKMFVNLTPLYFITIDEIKLDKLSTISSKFALSMFKQLLIYKTDGEVVSKSPVEIKDEKIQNEWVEQIKIDFRDTKSSSFRISSPLISAENNEMLAYHVKNQLC